MDDKAYIAYIGKLNKLLDGLEMSISTPSLSTSFYEQLIALNGEQTITDLAALIAEKDADSSASFVTSMASVKAEKEIATTRLKIVSSPAGGGEKCHMVDPKEVDAVKSVLQKCATGPLLPRISLFCHGVTYLDRDPVFFEVPSGVIYIETSIVGMDLLASADNYFRDFMINFRTYMKNFLENGTTGDDTINYVLAECSMLFPGAIGVERCLLGNPPGVDKPYIGTEFTNYEGPVVDIDKVKIDKTKLSTVIEALNGYDYEAGNSRTGTNKAYITNKEFLEAVIRRRLPGTAFYDSDFAGELAVVLVVACASKRVSKIESGRTYAPSYLQILNHQEYQIRRFLQIIYAIHGDKYGNPEELKLWIATYVTSGMGLKKDDYYKEICTYKDSTTGTNVILKMPNMSYPILNMSFLEPGFGALVGGKNITAFDGISMDGVGTALVTHGAGASNSSAKWLSRDEQKDWDRQLVAKNIVTISQEASKVTTKPTMIATTPSPVNSAAAAAVTVNAAGAKIAALQRESRQLYPVASRDRPQRYAAAAAQYAISEYYKGGALRKRKLTRRRKHTHKKRTNKKRSTSRQERRGR